MITIYFPPLVALVGCLAYALSANAKIAELGRLAYLAGLLVTLYEFAGKVFHV